MCVGVSSRCMPSRCRGGFGWVRRRSRPEPSNLLRNHEHRYDPRTSRQNQPSNLHRTTKIATILETVVENSFRTSCETTRIARACLRIHQNRHDPRNCRQPQPPSPRKTVVKHSLPRPENANLKTPKGKWSSNVMSNMVSKCLSRRQAQ